MEAMSKSRLALATTALAALLAFIPALPAAAHSQIIDSTPADGETLVELPSTFSVTANEDLSDITGSGEGFALEVASSDGTTTYSSTPLTIDGPTLSMEVDPSALRPGEYVLRYQVVSADGHPVSGEIPFSYAPEGTAPAPSASAPATGDDTAGDGVSPLAWIIPLAILLAAGIVSYVVVHVRRAKR